jgi:hypothetical protein
VPRFDGDGRRDALAGVRRHHRPGTECLTHEDEERAAARAWDPAR